MTVDAVAIAAHPEDVELMIGGTIAKLTDRGKSVAIIDLTRGELGSRGGCGGAVVFEVQLAAARQGSR